MGLIMNKKAFVSPIALIVSYLFFLMVWFLVIAEQLNTWGQIAIELNNLVGLEAFLFANLNLWVFIISLMALIAGVYVSGE